VGGHGRVPRSWHPETIAHDYLVRGERIVLEESRSVRAWIIDQSLVIVAGLALFLLLSSMGSDLSIGIGAVVLVLVAGFLAVRGAQAWFTRYVITDLRVLRVTGVFNRHAEFIPWGKVTDIGRSESFVQWLAGTATIRIESANERSAFRAMTDVEDPAQFYKVLVRMVDLKQGRVEGSTYVV
jgi:uncharacterized membrane protein YdbT with pleckstrin-like domain